MKTRIIIEVEGKVDLSKLTWLLNYNPMSENERHHAARDLYNSLIAGVIEQTEIPEPPLMIGDRVKWNNTSWQILAIDDDVAIIENGVVVIKRLLLELRRIK